jgi:hypothetical protein
LRGARTSMARTRAYPRPTTAPSRNPARPSIPGRRFRPRPLATEPPPPAGSPFTGPGRAPAPPRSCARPPPHPRRTRPSPRSPLLRLTRPDPLRSVQKEWGSLGRRIEERAPPLPLMHSAARAHCTATRLTIEPSGEYAPPVRMWHEPRGFCSIVPQPGRRPTTCRRPGSMPTTDSSPFPRAVQWIIERCP